MGNKKRKKGKVKKGVVKKRGKARPLIHISDYAIE